MTAVPITVNDRRMYRDARWRYAAHTKQDLAKKIATQSKSRNYQRGPRGKR